VVLLRELADGTFAVGLREGGLTLLDPETGAQQHHVSDPRRPTSLAGNKVRALLEGDAAREPGVLWVGTEAGLDRLDRRTGRVTHMGRADGLPSDYVVGIERDGAGRLWVSTDRGLGRYDPRRGTFKTYTRADGLQGNEFLMRSSFRARDGTLYFGGNTGFSAVRPDRVVDNTRRPPVVLTGLELFNVPVAAGAPGSPLRLPIGETAELTLTHAQNVVTFGFAALDFTAPEKTRYAYRMDGFDAGWQEVGHQRAASYTNLAPGRYTFRVRASNGDGVWNETARRSRSSSRRRCGRRGGSGCSRRPPARSARSASGASSSGGGWRWRWAGRRCTTRSPGWRTARSSATASGTRWRARRARARGGRSTPRGWRCSSSTSTTSRRSTIR
jgi:hypothetical protein